MNRRAGVDYPTIERVQFVEFCVREHPDRPRQEMLYKCSCAMDKIIAQMPYEEYVDASTAYLRWSGRRRARRRCAREHGRDTRSPTAIGAAQRKAMTGLPGHPVSSPYPVR